MSKLISLDELREKQRREEEEREREHLIDILRVTKELLEGKTFSREDILEEMIQEGITE